MRSNQTLCKRGYCKSKQLEYLYSETLWCIRCSPVGIGISVVAVGCSNKDVNLRFVRLEITEVDIDLVICFRILIKFLQVGLRFSCGLALHPAFLTAGAFGSEGES